MVGVVVVMFVGFLVINIWLYVKIVSEWWFLIVISLVVL